jgi:hypothetical protein
VFSLGGSVRLARRPGSTRAARLRALPKPGDTRVEMKTRLWAIAWLVVVSGCAGSSSPASTPPGTGPAPAPTAPGTTPTDPGAPPVESTACAGAPPGAGYACVQDCGPPVAREGDPPPGYHWLSAEQAQNRKQYGCPICLPAQTRIATPDGERAVSSLAPGDAIWTLDREGRRVAGHVLYANSTPLSGPHHVVRVTLADGRVVAASPGHPTLAGRTLGDLHPGDALSGSVVQRAEAAPFTGRRTFDVLPSGATGAYWADGVLLRSSFRSYSVFH